MIPWTQESRLVGDSNRAHERGGRYRGLNIEATGDLHVQRYKPKLFQVSCFQKAREVSRQRRALERSKGLLRRPGLERLHPKDHIGAIVGVEVTPLNRLINEQSEKEGNNIDPRQRIEREEEHPPSLAQSQRQRLCRLDFCKERSSHS